MKKILITGGAGYIGTEIVQTLSMIDDADITIYDNLSSNNFNLFLGGELGASNVKFIDGDILDSRKIKKVLAGIDTVVHMAAKVTTPYSDRDLHQYEQINHWGTSELVYHIENEDSVKKVIYLSSASVYGLGEDKVAYEDTEPRPSNYYGLTKLRAENEIMRLEIQKDVQILRVANVFGYSRSMRFDSVINRFMFDAHFNKRIKVYGNGSQIRPFISIDKTVELLTDVLNETKSEKIINVSEFNFSINDVIFEGILKLYPETEILFISQDLPLKSLELYSRYDDNGKQNNFNKFREYLETFNLKFSF
jgi:UDP-glucose 4-epimerase